MQEGGPAWPWEETAHTALMQEEGRQVINQLRACEGCVLVKAHPTTLYLYALSHTKGDADNCDTTTNGASDWPFTKLSVLLLVHLGGFPSGALANQRYDWPVRYITISSSTLFS